MSKDCVWGANGYGCGRLAWFVKSTPLMRSEPSRWSRQSVEETLFEELKRYVQFDERSEQLLQGLHPLLSPHFERIADVFYRRILAHDEARTALEGGESQVGRLKVTLVLWMEKLLTGPWDQEYFALRARIGRVHVRISLPQHYMLGAMNVIRGEMNGLIDAAFHESPERRGAERAALAKILDLELAIMLHTYREDLLAQQSRTERLATFGQLVGSIGHELRNPLGVIETSLYILKGRVDDDERATKHIHRIDEQLKIANDIITQLLDMIRDRPLDRARCSLAEVIEQSVASVSTPEAIHLSIHGLALLPPVDGDAGQLRQVFVNLLDNAVQALEGEGEVQVNGLERDGGVEISVEDNGPGLDATVSGRLFEPLITTKQKGIGLGLALVKRIVERHGGQISYRAGSGGGARFIVWFPVQG